MVRLFDLARVPAGQTSIANAEPFKISSLTAGSIIRTLILVVSILNFLFIPFSPEVFKAVVSCSWITLLLYLFSEQASLFALRSTHPRTSVLAIVSLTVFRFLQTLFHFNPITGDYDYTFPPALLIEAASSAGILILGCHTTNRKARFEVIYLCIVAVQLFTNVQNNAIRMPVALCTTASWENIRLLISFLYLRLAVGTLLHSIIIGVTTEGALRGQISGVAGSFKEFDEDERKLAVWEKRDGEKSVLDPEATVEARSSMKLVLNLSISLILLVFASFIVAAGLMVVIGIAYGMAFGGVYIWKRLATP